MNQKNIEQLFQNYIENFDYFVHSDGEGYETYKWEAVAQAQDAWKLQAADLSGMIKSAFSKTYNLINNRIVSPGNGLVLLAKQEPEVVRKALEGLLADTEGVDEKQDNILRFVDEINGLLEKFFPGKWKYTHDLRVAVTYLALIKPSENYLFKSTPAHDFAKWMEFDTDLGYGADFKLKYYYQMCDELIEKIKDCPELLEKNTIRQKIWADEDLHLLATDLIFCFGSYPFMNAGLNEPVQRKKSSATSLADERAKRAGELQSRLEQLQDEIDELESEIAALPAIDFAGKTFRTKMYGEVTIDSQEQNYLSFTANGSQRQFALPGCVVNGFLIIEDPVIIERYQKEAELLNKLQKLNSEQRIVNMELGKY